MVATYPSGISSCLEASITFGVLLYTAVKVVFLSNFIPAISALEYSLIFGGFDTVVGVGAAEANSVTTGTTGAAAFVPSVAFGVLAEFATDAAFSRISQPWNS